MPYLDYLVSGPSNRMIADRLDIREEAVKTHMRSIVSVPLLSDVAFLGGRLAGYRKYPHSGGEIRVFPSYSR
jgi:hypothetical protein